MHDAYKDTEQRLKEAQQWVKEHVPDEVLDDLMGRAWEPIKAGIDLKSARRIFDNAKPEEVPAALVQVYCAAYVFHLTGTNDRLPIEGREAQAMIVAHREVVGLEGLAPERASGAWG